MGDEPLKRIHDLLQEFETAMLVTETDDHPPRARPMVISNVDEACGIWFFTARDTGKVHEIEADQQVLITLQDQHNRYVSLRGTAELVKDAKLATQLRSDRNRTWFPRGPEDPNLLLIHVIPEEVEYWDANGEKSLHYLFETTHAR